MRENQTAIKWSSNLAYAIGLITSDGNLRKDKKKIWLSSKDLEILNNFKTALSLKNKIGKYARGGESDKKYFYVNFSNANLYDFLLNIGITPVKSKTIKSVDVPNRFFADSLRGYFDGDGTFYSFWDKRWPNSFSYKMAFASASSEFVVWLKKRLTNLYGVKGFLHKGKGVINLEYVKGDSKDLFETMYYKKDLLFLNRKYTKVKTALDFDSNLRNRSRTKEIAAVAHWQSDALKRHA